MKELLQEAETIKTGICWRFQAVSFKEKKPIDYPYHYHVLQTDLVPGGECGVSY